jgi:5-methyltetrahydrofolate--homocysteine methyltransferase
VHRHRFHQQRSSYGGWPWTDPFVVRLAAGTKIVGARLHPGRAPSLLGLPAGLSEQVKAINRAGVAISLRAVGESAYVFASVGPSGKLLMSGEVTEEQLSTAFREQTRALAAAGAHGIVIETMSDLAEAVLATAATREAGLPIVACMTFDSGKLRDRTMMGVTPEQAAEKLTRAGADVIGANCGQGIDAYLPLCRRLHAATDRPIWIKPNACLPVLEGGRTIYKTTPEEFAQHATALVQAGAAYLGGCCGTSPAFIRTLSQALAAGGQAHRPLESPCV